jgi:hypothetical protein
LSDHKTTISVHTSPDPLACGAGSSVAFYETLLGEWFGSHVVLTSSGRGALLLTLTEWNLNRYRHRIVVPRMISACVLDAVIRRGFPIDAAAGNEGDATLHYHQYGFSQRHAPGGLVVEDICHAFFGTKDTGSRSWHGEAAIFSLPKFLQTAAMVGGVATKSADLARRLRERRDQSPPSGLSTAWMSDVYRRDYHHGGPDLERVYLARLTDPHVEDDDLRGLPSTISEIAAIGAMRQDNFDRLLSATVNMTPADWLVDIRASLPFLFPVFGDAHELANSRAELREAGIDADVLQVDVRRDACQPRFEPVLMLPCHHAVECRNFEDMLAVLRNRRRRGSQHASHAPDASA